MAKGPLIIVSGPSGSGKSTIIAHLLELEKPRLRLAVSATTRPPRLGEIDGCHYHFWTREFFEEQIEAGAFLEWAEVFGNLYGTPTKEAELNPEHEAGVLLEIDVQGAEQVRRRRPETVSIFIRPPSLQVLEERLRQRETEHEEVVRNRLEGAKRELARADEYDFQVVNDDLDRATAEVRSIILGLFERDDNA